MVNLKLYYSNIKIYFNISLLLILARAFTFLGTLGTAKYLGILPFSEYILAQTALAVAVTIACMGSGIASTKMIAENKSTSKERLTEIINNSLSWAAIIGLIVTIAFLISINYTRNTSEINLNTENFNILIKIGLPIVFLESIIGVQIGIFYGLEKYKTIALISLFQSVLTSTFVVVVSIFFGNKEVMAVIVTLKFLQLIQNFIVLRTIMSEIGSKIKFCINKKVIRELLSISIPGFLGGLTQTPVLYLCNVFLSAKTNGLVAIGQYNAALQIRTIILLIPDILGKFILPKLSSQLRLNDAKAIKFKIITISLLIGFISLVPASLAIFFSKSIAALYGSGFDFSRLLVFYIAITAVVIAISNVVGFLFIAASRLWIDLIFRLLSAFSIITFMYFVGSNYLSEGYAASIMIGSIILLSLQIATIFYIKLN